MLALAAIGVGGLGLLAMPLAEALGVEALSLTGEVLVRIAMLMLCFFIAGTFRPGPVGRAGALLCASFIVSTLAWDVSSQPTLLHYDYGRWSSHATQLSAAIPFAWSAGEAALAWLRTRRRARLGLADPQVTERFLIWCLATSGLVTICLLAIVSGAAAASGAHGAASVAQGLRGLLYLVVTALIWRARFAPARPPQPEASAT
jgi:hypothetical protein